MELELNRSTPARPCIPERQSDLADALQAATAHKVHELLGLPSQLTMEELESPNFRTMLEGSIARLKDDGTLAVDYAHQLGDMMNAFSEAVRKAEEQEAA